MKKIKIEEKGLYSAADLPAKHTGKVHIENTLKDPTTVALGWMLGAYAFDRYKKDKKTFATLTPPKGADMKFVQSAARATYLVRDLINTPPNDFGPAELEAAARKTLGTLKVIRGNDLLKKNYPMIHAVGKGSPRAPRLIDFTWGNAKHKKITLVGKGVCFDTGGLNLKPGNSMALMKKDMGGAAHVLGLARMIMDAKLPVRLRVLIPAVENSMDGNSFRPSDILKSRAGITVEIGDTDAEGRLVLADCLTEASSEKPDLMIDFATLTGAARVALGPDLPAMFSNNDKIAEKLMNAAMKVEDPIWRMPLWQPYAAMLNSKAADINNVGSGGMAGAITAALFLEKFVGKNIPWVHIDTYAWNPGSKPGRPEGGEALGMRACFEMLKQLSSWAAGEGSS